MNNKITVIYLMSGNSKRFKSNKMTYFYKGKYIFEYGLDIFLNLKENTDLIDNIITVTKMGESYEKLLLKNKNYGKNEFHTVINKNPELGISSSMIIGICKMLNLNKNEKEGYVLFSVGDEIYLKEKSIYEFLRGFLESKKKIGAIGVNNVPYNPVIFHSCYLNELLSIKGDKGGKEVLIKHSEDLYIYNVAEEEIKDIDTPMDLD